MSADPESSPSLLLGDKRVIFLLQSRAAGLTTFSALQEEFGDKNIFKLGSVFENVTTTYQDFVDVAPRDIYLIYAGHFCFGDHQLVPTRCHYFTILRHPVERVLSVYEAACRLRQRRLDLGAWLETEFEANDGMVKRLCGIGRKVGESDEIYDFVNRTAADASFEAGSDDLNQARTNLENHFSCVLIQEMFAESMVVLQHTYGTGSLFAFHKQFLNHSPVPTERTNYPPELIDQITVRNRLDIGLYEEYHDRLRSFVARQDADFAQEVRILKGIGHILSERGTQVLTTENVIARLNEATELLIGNGHPDIAIKTLRCFTTKTYTNQVFCRSVLDVIRRHGNRQTLEDEIERYRNRFGEDDEVSALIADVNR